MSNSTDAILQDAFELIEQNELEKARETIAPLLESDSDNPAVWWVYAHAVKDKDQGIEALNKVIQLDPTYPGANELKARISAEQTPVTQPADEWDDLSFEPDSEFAKESTSSTSGRSPLRFLLTAILVILIVVAIFAVLSGALGSDPATPTAVANQSDTEVPTNDSQIITSDTNTETPIDATSESDETEIPTDEPTEVIPSEEPTATEGELETDEPTDEPSTEVAPTEAAATDEPTEMPTEETSYIGLLIENLSDYEISDSDLAVETTLLGETLIVSVCATLGPESSLVLNDVMDNLVEINDDFPSEVSAVAVTLIDCNDEQSYARTIGVDRSVVQSFANQEIELKDFQRAWQPLP